jgi:tetratricopeptide (TPR) repeat protein
MYRRQGKYLEAENWYRKAMAVNPSYAGNYVFAGIMAFQRGDIALAEQVLSSGHCLHRRVRG